MADTPEVGCARPTGGLVGQASEPEKQQTSTPAKEAKKMIQVGKSAPDFMAPAYHKGQFTSVKLSEHLGKWVCSVSIQLISLLFERPKYRRSPIIISSFRSWASKSFP